ncbi:MAG: alpha-xylosidase [Lachnospiraceae bacterium]|jgi:alpha-D-xyloside xylohydrolase|nr:alpha-xylosidase [Lachnospiraceae bacterium]
MKFQNGCWLYQEGYKVHSPAEVYYSKTEENALILCVPTSPIYNRGATLGGVNLTVKITSPRKEILRVQTWHHVGSIKDDPQFELEQTQDLPLDVKETTEKIIIQSGSLALEITKKPWSMRYLRDAEELTTSKNKDLALIKTNWKGDYYDKGDDQDTFLCQQLSVGVGELLYGTGERFTPFVKNGQAFDCWNEDGGTSTLQAYKNIPFYLSNKGYGVFVNHPEKVSFEMCSENVTKAQFSVPGGYLDYFVISGPSLKVSELSNALIGTRAVGAQTGASMKDVLTAYTDLTGKPSLPPPWTFGLWLSTSFTTNYDEKTVMSFIDGMLERGIPLRTFHFDCFWMKEFHWSDFVWDERVFPDPSGLLARIHEKGLNTCVWINPYIAQESCLFTEGTKKGFFVKKKDGRVWQWDMWQPGMALVDFTNPLACIWFQEKLEALMDMGVDCFKTDFGERIPTENIEYFSMADPQKMHNYYTYLYNKCVYDLLERKRGKGQAVLFARSATVGGQKFPVHWGGDCWSDYESMEESLRGGLSLLMSGFGYWAHDIGGFENTSTADVYKRWVAFGLLSSHSRLHGSTSYRVPWVYDEEAVEVVRFFTRLKGKLMPYLYRNAIETSRTGIPMMRSMVLEYTQDRNCAYLDKQYFLGDSLLVAPIFNDKGIAEYYLPDGRWTDYFTGREVMGGRWMQEQVDYLTIPLFVKENTLLALGAREDRPDYNYEQDAQIALYAPVDGAKAQTILYGLDAKAKLTCSVVRTGENLLFEFEAASTQQDLSCQLRLVNTQIVTCDDAKIVWRKEGNDAWIDHPTQRFTLQIQA